MQVEDVPWQLDINTVLLGVLRDSGLLHHTQSQAVAESKDKETRKLQEEILEESHTEHVDGHNRLLIRAALLPYIEHHSLHTEARLRVSCKQSWMERLPMDSDKGSLVLRMGISADLLVLATRSDKSSTQVMRMLQEEGACSPEKHAERRAQVWFSE